MQTPEPTAAFPDDATPPPGQWTDFFLAEVADREATIDALRNEVSRRDAVLDWLAENHPKALDLCPWKIASEVYRGLRGRSRGARPACLREGVVRMTKAATTLESALQDLVIAVTRGVPHYIAAGIASPLTGDESHADDCPGCAITRALVAVQEALNADA